MDKYLKRPFNSSVIITRVWEHLLLLIISYLQSINDRDGADDSWATGQTLTEGILNNLCTSDGPTWTIIQHLSTALLWTWRSLKKNAHKRITASLTIYTVYKKAYICTVYTRGAGKFSVQYYNWNVLVEVS